MVVSRIGPQAAWTTWALWLAGEEAVDRVQEVVGPIDGVTDQELGRHGQTMLSGAPVTVP